MAGYGVSFEGITSVGFECGDWIEPPLYRPDPIDKGQCAGVVEKTVGFVAGLFGRGDYRAILGVSAGARILNARDTLFYGFTGQLTLGMQAKHAAISLFFSADHLFPHDFFTPSSDGGGAGDRESGFTSLRPGIRVVPYFFRLGSPTGGTQSSLAPGLGAYLRISGDIGDSRQRILTGGIEFFGNYRLGSF